MWPSTNGGDPIFVPANTPYDIPQSDSHVLIGHMQGYLFLVCDASQEGSVGAGWYERHAYSKYLTFDVISPALEFDPDRFLDERLQKYLTSNPFIFIPFNAGPRICPGQQVSIFVHILHFT